MILIAMLFTAIGTAIASVVDDMQGFPLIMNFLVMPLFFLSGSLFPLAGLPGIIETIARLDPLSYGIDGLRGALVPGALHFGFWFDFGVLGVITTHCARHRRIFVLKNRDLKDRAFAPGRR